MLFHVATRYLLNVFFPFFLTAYVAFIDWPALAARLRERGRGEGGAKAGSQNTEVGSQNTEVGSQNTEVRSQKSE